MFFLLFYQKFKFPLSLIYIIIIVSKIDLSFLLIECTPPTTPPQATTTITAAGGLLGQGLKTGNVVS